MSRSHRKGSWGTGLGLGKDLQGMATKLDVTATKGKAGLGLGQAHPSTSFSSPNYTPQPDKAILTNDCAVLTFEEMEWWRIMQQRKPAKLLRSKFLPQDDILLSLQAAREIMTAHNRGQASLSDATLLNQTAPDSAVSNAEGGWDIPLLSQPPKTETTSNSTGAEAGSPAAEQRSPRAVPSSPASFCLHQGLCVAPQGTQHSRSFWNMASLESAFNICSSLTAVQQADGGKGKICILDLSSKDSGAAEYVLTHAAAKVQSAQVIASESADKLKHGISNAAEIVQVLPSKVASELFPSEAKAPTIAAAIDQAAVKGNTNTQAAAAAFSHSRPEMVSAAYSLGSFEGLKTHLRDAHLVIGSLVPADEQSLTAPGMNTSKGTAEGQHAGSSRQQGSAQSIGDGQDGVMEAEYGNQYRARLLWECRVALTCLQPGTITAASTIPLKSINLKSTCLLYLHVRPKIATQCAEGKNENTRNSLVSSGSP